MTTPPGTETDKNTPADGGDASGEPEVTLPILDFQQGLPGFANVHKFTVLPLQKELRPFCRMICLDELDAPLEFIVVPPGPLFPEYVVEIDDDNCDKLGLKEVSDVEVLLIVDPLMPPAIPTANLLGPIVINRRTLSAAQVILHNSGYSSKTPLPTDKDKNKPRK